MQPMMGMFMNGVVEALLIYVILLKM